ncbi:IucA/IucC family protein [Salimicrobium halophilum]|uniref:Siderophore synthetase component n=1 Tax=Salimicrobium halophilum TaxID=86666 RepID=A0A1G8TAY2_9BACI|nr:IucA/IucC family protein [Salimicrobium halophilum]SDJ38075.1 Siderophore synthetase component [Salimicrobium halophilum]
MSIRYDQEAERYIYRLLLQSIIRERLVAYNRTPAGISIEVPKGGIIEVPITHTYKLGHIDISNDPVYIDSSGSRQVIDRMEQLLMLLGFQNERFLKELMNSALNYASALEAADMRKQKLPAPKQGEDTWVYVTRRYKEEPDFSPLVFFEQWVIQGHTTHPAARTKLSMEPEDVKRYAPEWGATPGLVPLAVKKESTTETAPFDIAMTEALLRIDPGMKREFDQLEGDYKLIPLHPWQVEHTLPEHYSQELREKIFVPLETKIPSAALMSFRTMAIRDYHIKTAVNVQMTSAVRTVSAASTKNGPIMAGLLKDILKEEETMTVSGDLAGIHYKPDHEENRTFYEKNIAAILRENPETSLREGEVAMPAAALITESPVTGRLLAEEFVGEATEEAVSSFIESYARTLLPGMVRLLSEYGIGMEAHLQNSVIIFKNRKPVRVDLRDCGGVRILPERLNRHFEEAPIDPSTNLLTDREEELTDIFSHALFHNHLGEIITALARNLEVPEEGMWASVKTVLEECFKETNNKRDQERIVEANSRMKSLVWMRLSDQFTDYTFVDAPNPFLKEERTYDESSDAAKNGH